MKPATLVAIIAVLLIPLIFLIAYEGFDTSGSRSDRTSQSTATPTPNPTKGASVTDASQLQDPADAVSATKIILQTSKGDILINLFSDVSPKTVTNFVTLGKRGYYTNLIFHRVIKDFMIQGGDPKGTGTGGESIYGAKFPDEFNDRKIVAGSLAMANSGPNTNGSQFFIVTEEPQPHLDGRHTNFGQVADEASMAVVRAIAAVPVGMGDRPTQEVKITGFEIVE
jgi:cyclophilin family peptidyl-prolyl cis-trans isomerase